MSLILESDANLTLEQAGHKALALSRLGKHKLPVPEWFVISPEAFVKYLSAGHKAALIRAENQEDIDDIIMSIEFDAEFVDELQQAMTGISKGKSMFAVRSSGMEAQGSLQSLAGQLETILFVAADRVVECIKQVWCSAFNNRSLAWRKESGLKQNLQVPAVIVQRMINAEQSGIAFAVDPVSGKKNISVVSSVYGLGTGLVSGEMEADTFYIDERLQVIQRELADKTGAYRMDRNEPAGVSLKPVDRDMTGKASLEYGQVREVTELVRRASEIMGVPQDIEWVCRNGKFYILQSRTITNLVEPELPQAEGDLNIWDNSALAEDFNGVTTPLTFSFVRWHIESMNAGFCRVMRVPLNEAPKERGVLKRLTGLIRGRIYHNGRAWTELLNLVPGFHVNRKFVTGLTGIPSSMIDQLDGPETKRNLWQKTVLRLRYWWALAGLWWSFLRLSARVADYQKNLGSLLEQELAEPDIMRPEQLAQSFRDLETWLVQTNRTPLLNELFTAMFYRFLERLSRRWCKDTDSSLLNDLLSAQGGMVNAEPVLRMAAMARKLANNPELLEAINDGSLVEIESMMERDPELFRLYQVYLQKFGDRCLDELKLESKTLHDDPKILLQAIARLAWTRIDEESGEPDATEESELRKQAETRMEAALGRNPFRKIIYKWILKQARARVQERELLRFERSRVFGRVRRLFLETGERLQQAGVLNKARDIYYLQVDEVLGFIDGTGVTANLQQLVETRRQTFASWQRQSALAERIETHGAVHYENSLETPERKTVETVRGQKLKGRGCCNGIVRGTVRVVRDPQQARLKPGEILVAERTDPGWILLFPAASGILIERGNVLSHSAIIAREMGIPAIVSLNGVMDWLEDGDAVEFDGRTGVVRKMDTPEMDVTLQ